MSVPSVPILLLLNLQSSSCSVCSRKTEWKKLLDTHILSSPEQRGTGSHAGTPLALVILSQKGRGKNC